MDEAVFAGRLFKNNKGNGWTIVIYCLFVLVFGLLATLVLADSKTVQWIAGGALLAVLISVGLIRKLTFNEPDDKNIYISRAGIAIGMERYDWGSIEKVGIFVDAFYGFSYRTSGSLYSSRESSYGMDNWIYFRANNEKHNYRFLIPNHDMYFLLEDILAAWRVDGHAFAWKEKYGRAFVERAMGR
jgi:hypothetical protein